jgi:transposase InsO family protein
MYGELGDKFIELSKIKWAHPITREPVAYGSSTIERWYYLAKDAHDPVSVLSRQLRKDRGTHPSMTEALIKALIAQHRAHPSWSYQLHADNLTALAQLDALGDVPSYSTILRFMRDHGLERRARPKRKTKGAAMAAEHLEKIEVRSYESAYVNALWHYDFHVGTRRVLVGSEWRTPQLFGVMDDYSRLVCHMQWYLDENAENLVHGLSQAFQKRGLPREVLSDRGAAMRAAETTNGLEGLGIMANLTLPYSAYQNGKQETFWTQVEGRLVPMLESVEGLTLEQLNEATQAWVELEYNRSPHSETKTTPLQRYLDGTYVGRPSFSSEQLRDAFTRKVQRTQRRSDGTVSIDGVRFEVPSRFRHVQRLHLRHAEWDKSRALIVDETTDQVLARLLPIDKTTNAEGLRRLKEPIAPARAPSTPLSECEGLAPLLKKLVTDHAATGLPPAYVPKDEVDSKDKGEKS